MVLGLVAQVALHEDCDLAVHPLHLLPDPVQMVCQQHELLLRVCAGCGVSALGEKKIGCYAAGATLDGRRPLHPLSVSIPMTCNAAVFSGQHDVVFNMLYGAHTPLMLDMINAMASRLDRMTGTEHLGPVLSKVHDPSAGPDLVRATWILLLNVDMRIKVRFYLPCPVFVMVRAVGN